MLEQRQRPFSLVERAQNRRGIQKRRRSAGLFFDAQLPCERKRAFHRSKRLVLLRRFAIQPHQLVADLKLSPQIAAQTRFLEPIEHVALRAGRIVPGRVFVEFCEHALQRYVFCLRLCTVRLVT